MTPEDINIQQTAVIPVLLQTTNNKYSSEMHYHEWGIKHCNGFGLLDAADSIENPQHEKKLRLFMAASPEERGTDGSKTAEIGKELRYFLPLFKDPNNPFENEDFLELNYRSYFLADLVLLGEYIIRFDIKNLTKLFYKFGNDPCTMIFITTNHTITVKYIPEKGIRVYDPNSKKGGIIFKREDFEQAAKYIFDIYLFGLPIEINRNDIKNLTLTFQIDVVKRKKDPNPQISDALDFLALFHERSRNVSDGLGSTALEYAIFRRTFTHIPNTLSNKEYIRVFEKMSESHQNFLFLTPGSIIIDLLNDPFFQFILKDPRDTQMIKIVEYYKQYPETQIAACAIYYLIKKNNLTIEDIIAEKISRFHGNNLVREIDFPCPTKIADKIRAKSKLYEKIVLETFFDTIRYLDEADIFLIDKEKLKGSHPFADFYFNDQKNLAREYRDSHFIDHKSDVLFMELLEKLTFISIQDNEVEWFSFLFHTLPPSKKSIVLDKAITQSILHEKEDWFILLLNFLETPRKSLVFQWITLLKERNKNELLKSLVNSYAKKSDLARNFIRYYFENNIQSLFFINNYSSNMNLFIEAIEILIYLSIYDNKFYLFSFLLDSLKIKHDGFLFSCLLLIIKNNSPVEFLLKLSEKISVRHLLFFYYSKNLPYDFKSYFTIKKNESIQDLFDLIDHSVRENKPDWFLLLIREINPTLDNLMHWLNIAVDNESQAVFLEIIKINKIVLFDRNLIAYVTEHCSAKFLEFFINIMKNIFIQSPELLPQETQGNPYYNPLCVAAYKGKTQHVQLLLAAGYHPQNISAYNETPLYIACVKGYVDIMRMLFNTCHLHSIPILHTMLHGYTLFIAAKNSSNPEAYNELIKLYVDPNRINELLKLPLNILTSEFFNYLQNLPQNSLIEYFSPEHVPTQEAAEAAIPQDPLIEVPAQEAAGPMLTQTPSPLDMMEIIPRTPEFEAVVQHNTLPSPPLMPNSFLIASP